MELRVVVHVDELEKWGLALANMNNLINYCEEKGYEYAVEALVNAAAVKELREQDSQHKETINRLAEKGVVFAACRNALKGYEIDKKDVFAFVQVVPAGAAELVEKQYEGYAYIRP
jgi:intracellular sulfur oxidation DsrE/DsrF family protein